MFAEENSFIASNYCANPNFRKKGPTCLPPCLFVYKRIFTYLQQKHHTRSSRADFRLYFVEKGSALNPLSSLLKQCVVCLCHCLMPPN